MHIKPEEAMKQLQKDKTRAEQDSSGYYRGVFIGAAGAYLMAGVISLGQYMDITKSEAIPS